MVASPTFHPDLDASHQRINSDEWEEIYVVGDIHGCRPTLERLLNRLDPTTDELVVFVGDLVRKGPDSAGVIDIVRQTPNFRTVRGNNEQKLIDGRKSIPSLTDDDLSWIASLPVAISWADSLVVHGGVDHRKPIAEHELTELLNMRSLVPDGSYDRPYWFETRRDRPRIFFGHTVLSEPFETPNAVGLDTGCVYGGQLTAYQCSTGDFITVEPETTHEDRSADSIVDPERAKPTSV
ncbi:metallophosphoesterase family protein [Haloarcula marismortui]|uniref:metallophosphoesterase family protein n=1 Tax=Haloarcula marismortui TaxID=2238 RepID=UPI003C796A2C